MGQVVFDAWIADPWMLLNFLGGIGLFLLGMRLMTDGLRVAAGDALHRILAASTRSRWRAFATGILLTGVVQSSSAVIFATIGFVNVGMLSLVQAVGVIYGANVGTTVTSWLVSQVGLEFSVRAMALPVIAVGVILRVLGDNRPRGALGDAITGFGVFFLGLDVLTGLFRADAGLLPVDTEAAGFLRLLSFFLGGVAMTVVMQSSSAAIAVTLTAAAGGLMGLPAAAAMVVGANVGTTSTAVFAAIAATANARRVAAAHVIFNLVEACVLLLFLGMWLRLVELIVASAGLNFTPATALAVFHTMGKLIGLAIMWPLTRPMVGMLTRYLEPRDEGEGRPRYLDEAVMATPVLGLLALLKEQDRAVVMTRRLVSDALDPRHGRRERLVPAQAELHRLLEAVNEATHRVSRHDLSQAIAEALPNVLRVSRYLDELGERAVELAELRPRLASALPDELEEPSVRVQETATARLQALGETATEPPPDFETAYQALKASLLRAGAAGRISPRPMTEWLDWFSALRRMVKIAARAGQYLEELHRLTEEAPGEDGGTQA
jgi:phosphate:Na+ symporter